jgi:hypothetical protein
VWCGQLPEHERVKQYFEDGINLSEQELLYSMNIVTGTHVENVNLYSFVAGYKVLTVGNGLITVI